MNPLMATPRGTITIRAATVEDAPAYRELRLEALRNHPEAFSADYAANLAQPMSFWTERLKAAGTGGTAMIYLAWHEREPVGLCGIHRSDTPKTRHCATIVGMHIRPAWRGLRIADGLVAACLDWARANDVKIVKLGAVATRASAFIR